MLSVLACAIVLTHNQQFAPHLSDEPALAVNYKIRLYDRRGLISAPRIRTLPDQEANIAQTLDNHDFSISVLPTLNADRTIGTQLALSIDGLSALHAKFNTLRGGDAFLRLQKVKSGKTTLLIATESPMRPEVGKDDLLAIVTTIAEPADGSDPFFPPRPKPQPGAAPPKQIIYKLVFRSRKGVIGTPIIRTLSGYLCTVNSEAVIGDMQVRLLPRDSAGERIINMIEFRFSNEDPVYAIWGSRSGGTNRYKLWKEDAATPRMVGLHPESRVHLKQGELLVDITMSQIEDDNH